MTLKHAENKWNFERQRRQTLEEENEKLRTEIAEAGNVQRGMFLHEESGKDCKKKKKHFVEFSYCVEAGKPMA